MKFHTVPVDRAEGMVLAHATPAATPREADSQMSHLVAKGTVLDADHIADFKREAVAHLLVAELEPGDVAEDPAALRLAQAIVAGRTGLDVVPAHGGRVNLKAQSAGIVDLDPDRLTEMNRISPSITVATVPPWKKLGPGGLAATIKIIPFAVPGTDLKAACAVAGGSMGLATSRFGSATLIETRLDRTDPAEKGRRSTKARLAHFGVMLSPRVVVPHGVESLAEAMRRAEGEVLLILTGTATSDERDTAPEAVRAAGGVVIHYGMPVDPGNLIFVGDLAGKPVIGLPGCARSPALNGADWVLERILCGGPVAPADIMGMGVGGLLKEIPERGRKRDP